MRVVLVGTKQTPRTAVARELERAYKFKVVGMLDAVERIYRIIYFNNKWNRVRWEKTVKIYDALYEVDPEIWIQYMERRLSTSTQDIVIPDVRYVAELDRLRNLGFTVVRVREEGGTSVPHPGKSLLDAGEGTVIVHEYYGKLPVDFGISFENRKNMVENVSYLVSKLKER
jgi:hypothetical protein